jgi:hypothetical protein
MHDGHMSTVGRRSIFAALSLALARFLRRRRKRRL